MLQKGRVSNLSIFLKTFTGILNTPDKLFRKNRHIRHQKQKMEPKTIYILVLSGADLVLKPNKNRDPPHQKPTPSFI